MIANYAWQFFLLGQFVEDACYRLGIPKSANPMPQGEIAPQISTGNTSLFAALTSGGPEWLDDKERKDVASTIRLLDKLCKPIEVLKVGREIERVLGYIEYSPKREVVIHIEYLKNRIADELIESQFLHIPQSKIGFYRVTDLFGEEIGSKFPKVSEDISNAGTCYALGQNTAWVFHLMRVMEHCVQRFGRKLKVSIDVNNETWHQIMLHVHKQIDAMPGGVKKSAAQRNRKQKYATAAGRLDHVRIAWRNDVMHPKATYDEAEALEVLRAVETFLKSAVAIL
jgi:hypothetical protein